MSTQLALSPPFYLPSVSISSDRHRHAVAPCHASFPLTQDELTASALSFDNASSRRFTLSSQNRSIEIILTARRQPPFPDLPTHTLHCYKKVISTLVTLPTTQPHLYFASSLFIAPYNWSSTHRCHFLSPSSHVHHPSTQ
jgi:hypothetical protein